MWMDLCNHLQSFNAFLLLYLFITNTFIRCSGLNMLGPGSVPLSGWTMRPSSWLPEDAESSPICLWYKKARHLWYILALPATCLPRGCHAFCLDDNRLNHRTCKLAPTKCCPLWELPWSWCFFTAMNS